MTKERIEIIRQALIPFVKKKLLEINYEGLGKSDAKEFEKDLNEVLDLAIEALEQQSSDDCKIFGTKENCFGGATENECNHCDYKIQALEQDTVSRETYTSEHFARKEAEYKLWDLKRNCIEIPKDATN